MSHASLAPPAAAGTTGRADGTGIDQAGDRQLRERSRRHADGGHVDFTAARRAGPDVERHAMPAGDRGREPEPRPAVVRVLDEHGSRGRRTRGTAPRGSGRPLIEHQRAPGIGVDPQFDAPHRVTILRHDDAALRHSDRGGGGRRCLGESAEQRFRDERRGRTLAGRDEHAPSAIRRHGRRGAER
jgi:hypothetical protein